MLRAKDTGTVQYVVCTDTYLDTDGEVYTKTFLNIQRIWRGVCRRRAVPDSRPGHWGPDAKSFPVQGETGPAPRYQSSHIHGFQNGRSQEVG